MRVALDIDGVVANTMLSVQNKVVEKFGFEPDNLVVGNYMNIYKFEDSHIQKEVDDYIQLLFQTDAEVYTKATEVPCAWSGSMVVQPVAYITRRPDAHGIGEATRDWLTGNLFYPAPVYFIPKGECKSTKAKELGVDVLIEDSPYEIASCRENGLRTLVMSYDYNKHLTEDGQDVVHSWDEIVDWYTKHKFHDVAW